VRTENPEPNPGVTALLPCAGARWPQLHVGGGDAALPKDPSWHTASSFPKLRSASRTDARREPCAGPREVLGAVMQWERWATKKQGGSTQNGRDR
jgi:hypothetical protein